MARLPLQAEGKSKKEAIKAMNRALHRAEIMGLCKDGRTMCEERDGKFVAKCCVHS